MIPHATGCGQEKNQENDASDIDFHCHLVNQKHLNIVNVSIFLMAVTFRYLVVLHLHPLFFSTSGNTSTRHLFSWKQPFQNGLLSILTLCSPRRAKFCRYGNKRRNEQENTCSHTHTNIKHIHASTQSHKYTIIKGSHKKKSSCVNSLLPSMKKFVLSCLPSTN